MQTKFSIYIVLTFIIFFGGIEAEDVRSGGRGGGAGNDGPDLPENFNYRALWIIIGTIFGIVLIIGLCCCYYKHCTNYSSDREPYKYNCGYCHEGFKDIEEFRQHILNFPSHSAKDVLRRKAVCCCLDILCV